MDTDLTHHILAKLQADLAEFRAEVRSDIVELRTEMNQRFEIVDQRFERVERRIDQTNRTMLAGEARLSVEIGSLRASLLEIDVKRHEQT